MEVATCSATRRDGTVCEARPLPNGEYCWAHDPQSGERRKAALAAGGRNRSTSVRAAKLLPPELRDAERKLLDVIDKVESGEIKAREAEVIGGLIGRYIDLRKFGMETAAVRALDERLAQIEARQRELAG